MRSHGYFPPPLRVRALTVFTPPLSHTHTHRSLSLSLSLSLHSDALEDIGGFAAEAQAAQEERRARRQAAAAKRQAASNAVAASFASSWRASAPTPKRKAKLSDAPLSMDGGEGGNEEFGFDRV